MDRRTFLVGLGKFAGAVLVVPALPTIFDMGRDTGIAAPPLFDPKIWAELGRLKLEGMEGAGYAISQMRELAMLTQYIRASTIQELRTARAAMVPSDWQRLDSLHANLSADSSFSCRYGLMHEAVHEAVPRLYVPALS